MADLNPDFSNRLGALQSMLRDKYGLDTSVGSGLRDNDKQAQLYAQGRTAPGPVVTNAPPGSSYHNFGAAADLVPKNMKQADAEKVMRQAFQDNQDTGLTWGGSFKSLYDPFHVQLGTSLQSLRDGGAAPVATPAPQSTPPGQASAPSPGMLSGAQMSGAAAPSAGMLAGQDMGASETPDIGPLIQRALAMMQPPTPAAPLQPIPMPIPAGLRARLQGMQATPQG